MTLFEYEIVYDPNRQQLVDMCNSAARNGWRVIGFSQDSSNYYAMLEREKIEYTGER